MSGWATSLTEFWAGLLYIKGEIDNTNPHIVTKVLSLWWMLSTLGVVTKGLSYKTGFSYYSFILWSWSTNNSCLRYFLSLVTSFWHSLDTKPYLCKGKINSGQLQILRLRWFTCDIWHTLLDISVPLLPAFLFSLLFVVLPIYMSYWSREVSLLIS